MRPAGGEQVQTFVCEDNYWRLGIVNSATLYAQFEAGKWYSVDTVGFRRESALYGCFPIVTKVQQVPAPDAERSPKHINY